jgi:hypothetical protein
MKTFKISLIILLLLLSKLTCGDIIVVDPHPVEICIKIANIDDYPSIAFIGYVDCPSLTKYNKGYRIYSTDCLRLHKSCNLSIYAVKKDYIKNKDIKAINWSKDVNALKSNITVKATSILTYESITAAEQDYKIVGFTDTSVVVYRTLQVIHYENGESDSTKTNDYTGDISKLKQDF